MHRHDATKLTYETAPEQVRRLDDDAEQEIWIAAFNRERAAGAGRDDASRAAWTAVLRRRDDEAQAQRRAEWGHDPRTRAANLVTRLAQREGGSVETALRYLERNHRELIEDVRRVWRMTD